MRNLFFVSVAFFVFSGTSIQVNAQQLKNAITLSDGNITGQPLKFIDGIEIKSGYQAETMPVKSELLTENVDKPVIARKTTNTSISNIEIASSLQFKYAQILNRNVEFIINSSLFSFIDEWWATRYRYGGTSKKGIDCSAFTSLLMSTVFAVKLPRTAREQFNESEKVGKDEMIEGDLVFFNTRGGVSHVGVYLGDYYFVHASTNQGVVISSLEEPYYEKRFIGGGRILE